MTRNCRKMIEKTADSLLLSKHSIQFSALFLLLSDCYSEKSSNRATYIAQICYILIYYDPQSAGINVQSPQSATTPRRLTLGQMQEEKLPKCFTYVTKTMANLTTFSRKPGNYNGTIIFEIDIIKNSFPLHLKFIFFATGKTKITFLFLMDSRHSQLSFRVNSCKSKQKKQSKNL